MKVLITHGWSEENTGDYAIEKSIQKVVEEIFPQEKIEFAFWSLFSKVDARLLAHNQYKTSDANTCVIPSLWGTPPIQYGKASKVLYVVSRFLFNSALVTSFYIQKRFLNRISFGKQRLKFLDEADFIIVKGGTFLFAPKGIGGIVFTMRIILPIIVAALFNKQIIVAPHSFGPYESKIGTALLFWALRKTTWIFCRERISVEKLKENGVHQVSYCPDMAFMLQKEQSAVRQDANSLKIGLTARPWQYLNSKNSEIVYKKYIDELAKFINECVDHYRHCEFQLIPQVIGPDHREDDSLALRDIKQKLDPRVASKVTLFERKTRTPEELVTLYSDLQVLVGTRMHSVIFALISGVPCIAISYLGPKHLGIMREFDLEDFVTSIDTVQAGDLFRKFQSLINHNDSAKIRLKAVALREEIIHAFREKLSELS